MRPLPRMRLRGALVLTCLLAALPAAAQTLLLVVQENANARPLSPPFSVREGISGDLFDAGYIVLDAPGASPFPAASELARLARSAGADMVLEVATDYTDTPVGTDLLRISARTAFALIDSTTSAIIAQGTRDATNKDRERDTSRSALGTEIGKAIAAQVSNTIRAMRP
jgi:hypothetical protein